MTKTHRAYCLRTCAADMTSHGSFVWPTSGPVECPDWHPRAECGNGLHGLLWGAGDGSLLNWSDNAKWLVVGVDEWVEIDSDKVKFPRAEVVFCGDRKAAVEFIIAKGADPAKCVGGTASAGNYGTASAGYRGTASAGNYGTASAGDGGTASACDGGTASACDYGTASAGYRGTASAGDYGTASAGYRGTASAGVGGTASAGNGGTASAGYGGTASAGYRGTASAGDGGTASGVDGTILAVKWWDAEAERYRLAVAYVGEDGIAAGTKYRCDAGKFIAAESETPAA